MVWDSSEDENWYYDPETDFDRQVLRHAADKNTHAMLYLLKTMSEAVDTLERFSEQDPRLSKADRIAVKSDVAEAAEALDRACTFLPTKDGVDNDS
jgi:hypothetical protein